MQEHMHENEKKVFETYEQLASEVLKKGYRHNPIYLARKAIVDWDLLASVPLQDKRVLNVGCFEPIDELVWAGIVKEWVAVDLSPAAIQTAQAIINAELSSALAKKIQFQVMDAQRLNFEDGEFDLAVSFSVLDHMPDPEIRDKAIREMTRVVSKGGYVVITVPNRYSYYRIMYQQNVRRGMQLHVGYQYFYSYWELKNKLISSGLKPLRFTSDMKNVGDLPKWLRGVLLPLRLFGDRMGFIAQKQP